MNPYLNNTGVRVSILAGIVVLLAAIVAPSWYIAGLAVVWAIASAIAINKARPNNGAH
ncbi:hypothetical protein [Prescottella equi]|uniref:hypothetical protein n=1 Tax=Rhodococcus hoagii TaxID=43767 RepID=UPI001EEBCC62|nr:hypothetical protein [Prescottella equi]